MKIPSFVRLSVLLAAVAAIAGPAAAAEFPQAAQPQLAATADGRVWLVFGRGQEIWVARSDDGGAHFAGSVRVAALPSLMLGRRRGPRIVAHGNTVTVTAMAGEFLSFHSQDAGETWSEPARINDVARSAREGLNGLAVAPDGRVYAAWLDLRGERTQLFGAESADGGLTWSPNRLIYRAPAGGNVCECCHPSAGYDDAGNLCVMWRNGLDGTRDMWRAHRAAGSPDFGPAAKIGQGTWVLKACPMDGGGLFPDRDGFATVWQRAGAIFFARHDGPETRLADGVQPVAAATPVRSIAIWQQGADLWTTSLAAAPAPYLLAARARFPALIALPHSDQLVLAYERGDTTVIEHL
jgi:hypothetical protein